MKKTEEEIEKEYNEIKLEFGKKEMITMRTYNKIVKVYIKDIEKLMKIILKQNEKLMKNILKQNEQNKKICKTMSGKYRIEIEI